jgi:hypothetical protein
LEKGALSEAAFSEFAEQAVLFCHITSRVSTDPHQDLLQKKGGNGFPYIVILDDSGNVVAKHAGARTIEGFEKSLAKANEFFALKAKAEGGDADAAIEVFLAQVEMGHFKPAEAREKAKSLKGLTAEQAEKVATMATDLEIAEIISSARSQADLPALGKKLAALAAEGKVSKKDAVNQWFFISAHAKEAKDAKLLGQAIEELKKEQARNPRLKQLVDQLEADLEKMKQ